MANTKIQQKVEFKTNAAAIWDVLTSSELFGRVSGASADIEKREDGVISLFGGMIVGKNLELIPGQSLVQEWRAKNWPEGVVSKVSFQLQEAGGTTTLRFEHTGFPADQKAHLESGWVDRYWKPIKEYLEA